jgi:hypothetical protein
VTAAEPRPAQRVDEAGINEPLSLHDEAGAQAGREAVCDPGMSPAESAKETGAESRASLEV